MELNSDLIMLQGVLNKCVKKTGEFTKINYRGGNEQNILYILEELVKFLTEKGYFENHAPNNSCTKQLDEIVLFLALNTVFKREPHLEEYSHLCGIIPKLSKCLFANICFGLDLVPQYGNIIVKFPLNVTQELVDPMVECLKKAKPDEQLKKAFIILRAVVTKFSLTQFSNKIEEEIEDIVQSCNEIMRHLTGVGIEYAEKMKQMQIFRHMGFTLLSFFDLLLQIDEHQPIMKRMLECLLATCCNIFSTVSVNVFCAWAEIQEDDQPLQIIIAGKAYHIIEKYQKFDLAKELISMLSTIARKPKSLHQLITEADIPTTIRKAGSEGPDQCIWFKAMINLQVFKHKDAVKVLEKYHHLCDEQDVLRLLSMDITPDDAKNQKLILKCASNLKRNSLKTVLISHFHDKGFQWHNETRAELTEYFNKLGSQIDENSLKEVTLLLLQNVPLFFYHLYTTIFKGSQVACELVKSVSSDVALINNVAVDAIKQILEENEPTEQNIKGYLNLFSALVDCEVCPRALREVLLSNMKVYLEENRLESLKCTLEVFKATLCELFQPSDRVGMEGEEMCLKSNLLKFLLTCSGNARCKSFLEWSNLKSEINSLCVTIMLSPELTKLRHYGWMSNEDGSDVSNDPWLTYYKTVVTSTDKESSLIDLVLPNFSLQSYTSGAADENLTSLMKILPCCAPVEWSIVLKELEQRYSYQTVVDILTDILILLCNFAQSQNLPGQHAQKVLPPLKYCLQNYGQFLKTISSRSKDDQFVAINSICRVLKHVPESLRMAEGVALIHIMPDDTLRSLSNDKEFVARIVLIGDKQLCKTLAQKVLGNGT